MTKKISNLENAKIRLQLYMAQCGIGSRRKCEEYIREEKVKVNGMIVTTPGFKVSCEDIVYYKGQRIVPTREKIYIALHKPVRYLCSNIDQFKRPLAADFFRNKIKHRLFHVGRLDYLSSGLIFFTNDGDFAYHITHPAFEIEKEYIVEINEKISESLLIKYQQGLKIESKIYSLKEFQYLSPYKIRLTMTEGKNREIRRVFRFFDIPVTRIHRIRIGIVQIESLLPGEFRHLSQKEVDWFLNKK